VAAAATNLASIPSRISSRPTQPLTRQLGGALVDTNGNLLGINTAITPVLAETSGIGFAIPVSTAKMVLKVSSRTAEVTRGWIGVEPNDLSPELAEAFGVQVQEGVIVTGVLQNGPAAKAGVRPGDVIKRIGERNVTDVSQAALPGGWAQARHACSLFDRSQKSAAGVGCFTGRSTPA